LKIVFFELFCLTIDIYGKIIKILVVPCFLSVASMHHLAKQFFITHF